MKKQNTSENIWDEAPVESVKPQTAKKEIQKEILTHTDFDIEGLMTDFPTAKELERFVYDETGIVLNLKGRANKLKYQIAMDVLNGVEVESKFLGGENPYVDKADMIPTEDLKAKPARDPSLPPPNTKQNSFYSPRIPHPDEQMRAQDKKVHMLFTKYKNGMISYEILGPLETYAYGEKIDKYGRTRPEIIKWMDPRTGEQVIMREDGTLTPIGKRLRAMMQLNKVNKSNQWDVWIDREFVTTAKGVADNPWDLTK